jgi:hypothetical protein
MRQHVPSRTLMRGLRRSYPPQRHIWAIHAPSPHASGRQGHAIGQFQPVRADQSRPTTLLYFRAWAAPRAYLRGAYPNLFGPCAMAPRTSPLR